MWRCGISVSYTHLDVYKRQMVPYQIGFANYAYIAPDFDLNGEKINTIDAKGKMHRLAVTVLPESNQSYIMLSCLSSEEKIYRCV